MNNKIFKSLAIITLIASTASVSASSNSEDIFVVNLGDGVCAVVASSPHGPVVLETFPCPREFRGDI